MWSPRQVTPLPPEWDILLVDSTTLKQTRPALALSRVRCLEYAYLRPKTPAKAAEAKITYVIVRQNQ